MFTKGSRYRNLTESAFLNAKGEWLRGKDLRLIRVPESSLLHTVTGGDRLDLLAYKYYGDTTKWWQISDANPECSFPVDLLDGSAIVEELFVLTHAEFDRRYAQLITALKSIGTVPETSINYFESQPPFESQKSVQPHFLEETILMIYSSSAVRRQVLQAIEAHGFHRLNSFSFAHGSDIAESFSIDHEAAKRGWHLLVDSLSRTPGILRIHSSLTEATLTLVYNSSMVSGESLSNLMNGNGFIVNAVPSSRIGRKIKIPPNQIV